MLKKVHSESKLKSLKSKCRNSDCRIWKNPTYCIEKEATDFRCIYTYVPPTVKAENSNRLREAQTIGRGMKKQEKDGEVKKKK